MNGTNIHTGKTIDGIDHLKQSIINIITTPIGSRVMRRYYGSRVSTRIDSPLNAEFIALIYADIVEALFNYEPRFELSKVSVVSMDKQRIVLDLEGIYKPNEENIRINDLEVLRN